MDKLCEILGTELTIQQSLALCRKCYNDTYSIVVELHKHGSSCGAIPNPGKVFNCHSPNAKMVTQHLKTTGQDIQLTPSDCLCFACYKLHCSIIETLKAESTDDMLQQDIQKWYNEPNTNKLTTSILAVVIYVAKQLLLQKAFYYHGHPRFSYGHAIDITLIPLHQTNTMNPTQIN